jgi:hypothetical protein
MSDNVIDLLIEYEDRVSELYDKIYGMIIEMDAALDLDDENYNYHLQLAIRRLENSRKHFKEMIKIAREYAETHKDLEQILEKVIR